MKATHLRRFVAGIVCLSFLGNCESLAFKQQIRSFRGMTNKQVSHLNCVTDLIKGAFWVSYLI